MLTTNWEDLKVKFVKENIQELFKMAGLPSLKVTDVVICDDLIAVVLKEHSEYEFSFSYKVNKVLESLNIGVKIFVSPF